MDPITAILVLIIIFGLLKRSKAKKSTFERSVTSEGIYPYQKKIRLLAEEERTFLELLESAVGHRFKIYAKVNVSDLIEVKDIISASAKPSYEKKINTACVSYVLCTPDGLKIACAITLGSMVKHQKNEGVDSYLNSAFKAASLPLVRFKLNYDYTKKEIILILKEQLELRN